MGTVFVLVQHNKVVSRTTGELFEEGRVVKVRIAKNHQSGVILIHVLKSKKALHSVTAFFVLRLVNVPPRSRDGCLLMQPLVSGLEANAIKRHQEVVIGPQASKDLNHSRVLTNFPADFRMSNVIVFDDASGVAGYGVSVPGHVIIKVNPGVE